MVGVWVGAHEYAHSIFDGPSEPAQANLIIYLVALTRPGDGRQNVVSVFRGRVRVSKMQ